jgi:hypothetical protein
MVQKNAPLVSDKKTRAIYRVGKSRPESVLGNIWEADCRINLNKL